MKKSISILLLFLFLFNICGFWLAFKIRQSQIYAGVRKEVKRALKGTVSENELHVFKITDGKELPQKAVWVKKGKEFRLLDNMFDIVRSENKEGEIILYCINDKQEEVLFEHLDEHIEKHIANKSKSNKSKTKSGKKANDYYDLPSRIVSIQLFNTMHFREFSERTSSQFSIKFSPPPELA